jgi:hypothetical protein
MVERKISLCDSFYLNLNAQPTVTETSTPMRVNTNTLSREKKSKKDMKKTMHYSCQIVNLTNY